MTKCTDILIREKCLGTSVRFFPLEMMKRAFLLFYFLSTLQGKSSKKGLCIPPGENFHCGDLGAFKNVRWVLHSQTILGMFKSVKKICKLLNLMDSSMKERGEGGDFISTL